MRRGVKRVGVVTVVLAMVALLALPAIATVDEITGMACSGDKAVFAPPGISDETKSNFAKPLLASGFATATFDDLENPTELDVMFNFDAPNSKYKGLGGGPIFIPEGFLPGVDLILSDIPVPDPAFPAFANCKNFPTP